MAKPTSQLINDIISFAYQQVDVAKAQNSRDSRGDTICTQVSCRLLRIHPADASQAAWLVAFSYYTNDENLDNADDVFVRIHVSGGPTPSFKKIKFWTE